MDLFVCLLRKVEIDYKKNKEKSSTLYWTNSVHDVYVALNQFWVGNFNWVLIYVFLSFGSVCIDFYLNSVHDDQHMAELNWIDTEIIRIVIFSQQSICYFVGTDFLDVFFVLFFFLSWEKPDDEQKIK